MRLALTFGKKADVVLAEVNQTACCFTAASKVFHFIPRQFFARERRILLFFHCILI
jgi:hypothetical protein